MASTHPLARELVRLRTAAQLTPQQVAARSRGRLTTEWVTLCESGSLGKPSIDEIRVFARLYGVAAWGLLKLAGYVIDQDALDGVAEMKRTARSTTKRAA